MRFTITKDFQPERRKENFLCLAARNTYVTEPVNLRLVVPALAVIVVCILGVVL